MQGFTLILGEDADAVQAGIETIGERKVDQAINTGKRNRRLGAVSREWIQALTTPAGQNEGKSA
jgi:hypothetical protein